MRLRTVVVAFLGTVLMTGCTLVYTLSVPRPQSRHDITGSLVIDGILGVDFDRQGNSLGRYRDLDERTDAHDHRRQGPGGAHHLGEGQTGAPVRRYALLPVRVSVCPRAGRQDIPSEARSETLHIRDSRAPSEVRLSRHSICGRRANRDVLIRNPREPAGRSSRAKPRDPYPWPRIPRRLGMTDPLTFSRTYHGAPPRVRSDRRSRTGRSCSRM